MESALTLPMGAPGFPRKRTLAHPISLSLGSQSLLWALISNPAFATADELCDLEQIT